MEIFLESWATIALGLIAFLDIIVSLTPTKKDDQFLGYFRTLVQAFANRSKRKEIREERKARRE